jgi:hypothetical protein
VIPDQLRRRNAVSRLSRILNVFRSAHVEDELDEEAQAITA